MRAAVVLVSLTLVALARGQRSCEAYERCVTITECPQLARLVSKKHTITAQEKELLRNSLCGWQNQHAGRPNHPQVCCPLLPVSDCGPINTPDKIIGGNRTVVKEFPWAVRLGYRFRGQLNYRCGGSLINNRYVLTAAHCVDGTSKPVSVRLGEHDIESDVDCSMVYGKQLCADPVVDVDIERIITHPEYEPDTTKTTGMWNDIALIRLRRPVSLTSSVSPVCLPLRVPNSKEDDEIEKRADFSLTVVGWGKISSDDYGDTSRYLMKLNLRSVKHADCADKYKAFPNVVDASRHMCAIGKDGTDVCRGDSGGPLTTVTLLGGKVRTVLRGVVSFGPQTCATRGVPGVFTRVSLYMPWILDNLNP